MSVDHDCARLVSPRSSPAPPTIAAPVPDPGRGGRAPEGSASTLTPRERRVLLELALGRTSGRAAAAIGLSPHTVRSHVKSAMRKLGAETRTQAVALAIAHGAIVVGTLPPGTDSRPPAQLADDIGSEKARSPRARDGSVG